MLRFEPWSLAQATWPAVGRHLLATFDDDSIVVYQAYRPAIAAWAVARGQLGGPDFSFTRMSWVKPNFLWMMHRSSWATAKDQERVLALRVERAAFSGWLSASVPSSCPAGMDHGAWRAALATTEVVVQWDPDHDPMGRALARRAVQVGLRGGALRALATTALREVQDITDRVVVERGHRSPPDHPQLQVPAERVMPVDDALARHLSLEVP
jgi:hypothetical protein